MRAEVLEALKALSDREYQEREWGKYQEAVCRYDDLALNVHILYDDCRVLPDPSSQVGSVLFPEDVDYLRRVDAVLGPLIDQLGRSPDAEYLADPRWDLVVDAAAEALSHLARRM